jgi:hypothetical protein
MSVDIERSEDHMSAIGPYTLNCWRFVLGMLTCNRARPLGERGGSVVGKGGDSDVKN